jgi:hypothetical protein
MFFGLIRTAEKVLHRDLHLHVCAVREERNLFAVTSSLARCGREYITTVIYREPVRKTVCQSLFRLAHRWHRQGALARSALARSAPAAECLRNQHGSPAPPPQAPRVGSVTPLNATSGALTRICPAAMSTSSATVAKCNKWRRTAARLIVAGPDCVSRVGEEDSLLGIVA